MAQHSPSPSLQFHLPVYYFKLTILVVITTNSVQLQMITSIFSTFYYNNNWKALYKHKCEENSIFMLLDFPVIYNFAN